MKKLISHCASICLFFVLFNSPIAFATPQAPTDTIARSIVDGANSLAFKLFNKLYTKDKNVAVAPQSISTLLTMVYNGANSNTKVQMGELLGIAKLNLNDVNQAYLDLTKKWQNLGSKIKIETANSIWVGKKIQLNSDFIARNKDFFSAEVNNVDFAKPKAVEEINSWVKKHTKGKIAKIVDKLDDSCLLAMVDAFYFKGKWEKSFEIKDTKEKPFYLATGQQEKVQMMSRFGHYMYLENNLFQAVMLPYGDNKQIVMYVFLPKGKVTLEQFMAKLTVTNWQKWLSEFNYREGTVELPRFKAEYSTSLVDVLKTLGMNDAFLPSKADFSGISISALLDKMYIDQIIHKTFIEVNEEGTEAAAVTAAVIFGAAIDMNTPPRFQFIADHPFFYAIVDRKSGAILFMGAMIKN